MHKKKFIYAIYDKIVSKLSMLYMLSKFLSNLAHAEMNAKCPKTGFSATSLIQNRLLCVIKHLWELVCEFSIVIYANIQACIKLIRNHAKKSSLNEENGSTSPFLHSMYGSQKCQ